MHLRAYSGPSLPAHERAARNRRATLETPRPVQPAPAPVPKPDPLARRTAEFHRPKTWYRPFASGVPLI